MKETSMQSATMKMFCRILILAMMSLSFQTASAGIIATGQAAAVAGVETDRALMLAALDRSDVRNQLQAQGVDPLAARERVAAMTDQELRTLAGTVATAPAGADASFLAVVAGGALIWYFFIRK
jgi:microcystin degradation protein MlrC